MRRVTLECPVLGAEELSDWARSGTNPGLGIDWDAPTNAHLTVLHLGRPAELHEEVTKARQSSAELPEQEFYTALLRWALQSCNLLKHAARVHVDTRGMLEQVAALQGPPEKGCVELLLRQFCTRLSSFGHFFMQLGWPPQVQDRQVCVSRGIPVDTQSWVRPAPRPI